MIWEVVGIALMLLASAWLIKLALEWWSLGSTAKLISNPVSHQARMADWEQRIDEALQDLAYYKNTPNWFDREWPICEHLSVSSDGEYCRNCFRQVVDHVAVTA